MLCTQYILDILFFFRKIITVLMKLKENFEEGKFTEVLAEFFT